MKLFLSASFYLLGAAFVMAEPVHTPVPGSAERKAILELLRPACERDLGQKVLFRVQHLRVIGEWALARVAPLRADGSEIDFARTKYRDAVAAGAFDAQGEALFQRREGKWKLLEWRFGATDTELTTWFEKYAAPAALAQE